MNVIKDNDFDTKEEFTPLDYSFKSVLSTSDGRDVLNRVLEISQVFTVNAVDSTIKLAFNEGLRSVGLIVLNHLVKVDSKAYSRLVDDYKVLEKDVKTPYSPFDFPKKEP